MKYVLEIDPSDPAWPRLVGPFDDRDAADTWAMQRIHNGSWSVCPLVTP